MRVIVQYEEEKKDNLLKYAAHSKLLGGNYMLLHIHSRYLKRLNDMTRAMELDFAINLYEEDAIKEDILNNKKMLVVLIGAKSKDTRVDAWYNMKTYKFEAADSGKDRKQYRLINCYASKDKVEAADYIQCIRFLEAFAKAFHKPLIIYSNAEAQDEKYRYRSLTYKIISSYVEGLKGVLISKAAKGKCHKYYSPSEQRYEFYSDHVIYLEDSMNDAIKKVLSFLCDSEYSFTLDNKKKYSRQSSSLYDNIFYQTISSNQEIYVPLKIGNSKPPEFYQNMGVEFIPLLGGYGFLYAKRGKFDELREQLRAFVEHPYIIPIISHQQCGKKNLDEKFFYQLVPENQKYKGQGTYIGIVTVDYVDYTNSALRTENGKSRIACIWEQEKAGNGRYLSEEEIAQALDSKNPEQIIKLPQEDSISTMMLGIAGGSSKEAGYSGVAVEAEFLVAKVNTAPEEVQRIFGGTPNKYAAMMADVLIGVVKLVEFAEERKKPLVLCIPFNTNIDPHDGSLIQYRILGLLASRADVTIIIPAGEEADKMHHYSINTQVVASNFLNIDVKKEGQNLIGILYQRVANIQKASLYPPSNVSEQPVNLKVMRVTPVKEARIYSEGYRISFLNGAPRIWFRLENPQVGIWRLELEVDTKLSSQTDIWVSQQELNEYITLSPSTSSITIGSLANVEQVITVGAYDEKSKIVLRSSGRGYSWNNVVDPNLVTPASNIIAPCGNNKWGSVTGTMPAAAIITGVAATLYSKGIAENIFPLPNSLVMNSVIASAITRLEGIEYPNPGYGNGIFELKSLNKLLGTPFIL